MKLQAPISTSQVSFMSAPRSLLKHTCTALLAALENFAGNNVDLTMLAEAIWIGWSQERDALKRATECTALVNSSADDLRLTAKDVLADVAPGRPHALRQALATFLG